MLRRRYWLVAIVAVLAVAVLFVWFSRSAPQDTEGVVAAASERASQTATASLTAARARQLEATLNERSAATIQDAVALGDDHDPAQAAREVLPDGARVRIDESTFTALEQPDYATAQAAITGSIDADVTLLLSATDGPWRIIGTTKPEPRS